MVDFELNSNKSMNTIEELLRHSGGSIASFCGGSAVIATIVADLHIWVAIVGGAIGIVGGLFGLYSKLQEIKRNERDIILKDLQIAEFQKSTERDNALFEQAKEAGERDKLKREILNEMK
jgi:hypothetical protein